MTDAEKQLNKPHRKKHSGAKAEKKKDKDPKHGHRISKNPKAFTFKSAVRASKSVRRTMDIKERKHHKLVVDRTPVEPPPIVVAIIGPPKVGKTTLVNSIIRSLARTNVSDPKGPITVVSGKKRRLTLIECNNDINSMIDVGKIADLALMLIDATYGFEMEIFEFLNVAQVHGFPKVMGVLTHLDLIKQNKALQKFKKRMKVRFTTEVYPGAKLFYLHHYKHGHYQKAEIQNLCRFISLMKFRPLTWRNTHPYILCDRMEDLTDPEKVRLDPQTPRTVSLYGYCRGVPIKNKSKVHILGCGDYALQDISLLPDPCPLPDQVKHRALNQKERLLYAPMSGVGGIVYDKDAVYIDMGESQAGQRLKQDDSAKMVDDPGPDSQLVASMLDNKFTVDQKLASSRLTLLAGMDALLPDDLDSEDESDDWTGSRRVVGEDEMGQLSDNHSDRDAPSHSTTRKSGSVQYDDGDDEDDDLYEDIPKERTPLRKSKVSFDTEPDDDLDVSKLADKLKCVSSASYFKKHAPHVALKNLIYGQVQSQCSLASKDQPDEADSLLAGLFITKDSQRKSGSSNTDLDGLDCSCTDEALLNWDCSDISTKIRDCFVTGQWGSKDASKVLNGEQDGDNELYGDFEDLETGEVYKADTEKSVEKSDVEDSSSQPEHDSTKRPLNDQEDRLSKKKRLKAAFDEQYDSGEQERTFFDEWKEEVDQQAQLNQTVFEDMDDNMRVLYEGFRPGLYARIEISGLPSEFVTNFDPSYPLILGGLLPGEDTLGYMQLRLKNHRWFKRVLKNRDPVVMSVGWRRFQTVPLYCVQDHNGRNRSIKYTPKHLHCVAITYGPIAPPGTGVLSVNHKLRGFRITSTGCVLDLDKSSQIVKKLKLTGVPLKIFKKTAFIQGMFNSALEVAKFEGATIRTVSGIRGQIKRALKAPAGAFRATFEDKILLSDTVFLRAWYPLEVPQYFSVVDTLLLPPGQKLRWQGMKTVAELRRERGLTIPKKEDSFYKPIEREERRFNPLRIPTSLQKTLPFKTKPKLVKKRKRLTYEAKRAVVLEPEESKVESLIRKITTLQHEKDRLRKEKEKRNKAEYMKKKAAFELKRNLNIKRKRKAVYRELGKLDKKKK